MARGAPTQFEYGGKGGAIMISVNGGWWDGPGQSPVTRRQKSELHDLSTC